MLENGCTFNSGCLEKKDEETMAWGGTKYIVQQIDQEKYGDFFRPNEVYSSLRDCSKSGSRYLKPATRLLVFPFAVFFFLLPCIPGST